MLNFQHSSSTESPSLQTHPIKQFWNKSLPLLTLMLPILITQAAQAGYGLVDTIMAGNVSADDLAAVAIGSSFWLPLFLFMLGIIIATTPLIGELLGKKQPEKIPLYSQQSLWFSAFCGLVAGALLLVVPEIFHWFDVPTHLEDSSKLYLYGVALGMPAVALYTSLRCYTEALGHPVPVTIISIIGVLADIPLNYIFIYGKLGLPAMGGAGCGFATAVVMWLTLFLLAGYIGISKTYKDLRFYRDFAKPNAQIISRIVKLGLPIGIAIFFEVSLFSIAAVVIAPLGSITVAAHQVAFSITSQLFMVPLSLALALTIRISTFYGEKNWHKLKQEAQLGFTLATGFALLSMLLIFIFKEQLVLLYSEEAPVQSIAMGLLMFALAYQLMDAFQVTSAGILRGIQDTKSPMWITFVSYWLVALPLGTYLSRMTNMGAAGFWTALVIGLTLAAVMLFVRLKQQINRLI